METLREGQTTVCGGALDGHQQPGGSGAHLPLIRPVYEYGAAVRLRWVAPASLQRWVVKKMDKAAPPPSSCNELRRQT
jgi:hypothetical protein